MDAQNHRRPGRYKRQRKRNRRAEPDKISRVQVEWMGSALSAVALLTAFCAAGSFTAMGMGSPDNRPQGADDSYRATWR